MRICVFEDRGVHLLEPLTLTRPAFDLWCGASPLLEKHRRAFAADEVGALVRPVLADLCRLSHPALAVNDRAWLEKGPTIFVNARWLPPAEPVADLAGPRVALVGQEVAYVVAPGAWLAEDVVAAVDLWCQRWKQSLPHTPAGGQMIAYPWHLVEHNPDTLCQDFRWFGKGAGGSALPAGLTVVGPADQVAVDPSATVEPFVVADTRKGPVFVDRGATLHSFTRLEGPCYVGRESTLLGARLRGGTIGPCCRVGGEVEASIIHGHSNKYHDGFLGHSYVGEWVNLAAGTQVSDLRNDYGVIRVTVAGQKVVTGLTKVGAFIGDHTKTGLNALLNTGTVVGAFSNLLPWTSLLPQVIPSFCLYGQGRLQERSDLQQLFGTVATVMRRRGRELTDTHKDFLFSLYEQTATERHQMIREGEQRRLRQSV